MGLLRGGNMKCTSSLVNSDHLIYHPDQNTFKRAKRGTVNNYAVTTGHSNILEKPHNIANIAVNYLCQTYLL